MFWKLYLDSFDFLYFFFQTFSQAKCLWRCFCKECSFWMLLEHVELAGNADLWFVCPTSADWGGLGWRLPGSLDSGVKLCDKICHSCKGQALLQQAGAERHSFSWKDTDFIRNTPALSKRHPHYQNPVKAPPNQPLTCLNYYELNAEILPKNIETNVEILTSTVKLIGIGPSRGNLALSLAPLRRMKLVPL